MPPKHQKVTTYTPLKDGSVKIEQRSYYDKLAQVVEDVERNKLSVAETLAEDVASLLTAMTKDKALRLEVVVVPHRDGYKITYKQRVYKQRF